MNTKNEPVGREIRKLWHDCEVKVCFNQENWKNKEKVILFGNIHICITTYIQSISCTIALERKKETINYIPYVLYLFPFFSYTIPSN